jgi:sugar phosphate isomerase/epimerase
MFETTRRRLLAAAGLAGANLNAAQKKPARAAKGPGREPFWGPGPDRNAVRKLPPPGPTPVLLGGYIPFPPKGGIGEHIRKLRAEGFGAAIISATPEFLNISESQASEVRAATKEHNLVIFEVGGYRNILHTVESSRQANLKHLARCLEAADRIGTKMVGTITGSRNPEGNQFSDNYAVHPDNWTLETWKMTISGIQQILKDTSGCKSVLGMEAQVTTNLDGPQAHRNLMEDVGSDRVKVNFDPTNMVHLWNHFHTTKLINECFDMLGEDIFGAHAKDSYVFPHSQTVHIQEVCPGRGSLDYETYLLRLSHMKWPRALLVEHIPSDQFAEAHVYIRKVAAKVGVKIDGQV